MSKKWIITWDAGYGEESEVVVADNYEAAEDMAYQNCREIFENNASYGAIELTAESAEEYGYEDELKAV